MKHLPLGLRKEDFERWLFLRQANCRAQLPSDVAKEMSDLADHIPHRLRLILGISTFQPTIFKGGLGDSDHEAVADQRISTNRNVQPALIDTDALIGDLNASFDGGAGMDALAHCPASMFRDGQAAATSERFSSSRVASAHDQGGIDETGFWIARVGRAKAEPRKVKRRGREASLSWTRKKFRYLAMATKEIAESIRKSEFAKLEKFIASKISS